ncbi:hypothetical protein [Antarcticirhabdus aurantiaca]|uniref:Uncharacterized protein n=1 Tax=Antarcticirhabdus aurantiaca TaxID=2606717 RepID=A0ACD4NUY9_9HYPH|nr:hypothetical protein [Antarcticirhabdus aurantiaca]WAJ30521.1 hypothetical protein OXU80_10080 [Jeongeuplla avenae]
MRIDNQMRGPDPRLDADAAERRSADNRAGQGFGRDERFGREGHLHQRSSERDFGSFDKHGAAGGRDPLWSSHADDAARGHFEDRLRLAGARHGKSETQNREPADEGAKLLAMAGGGASALAGGFVAVSAPERAGATPAGARVAGIEDLALRVEKAAEASFAAASAGEPLRIDFPVGGTGIGGLTLTITPDAIDLVFLCDEAGMGALAAAAQSLADRLHARWPGRTVRIHEKIDVAAADDRAAGDGLSEISQLFGRGDARS